VRVGDDRRRAVRQDGTGELGRRGQRRLDVDVAVDQPRADVAAREVDLKLPVVAADADDVLAEDGDVGGDDLT
jgi:hypothetical protein